MRVCRSANSRSELECSPMALYSYFADKQALLIALAQEGFEKVGQTVRFHR